MWVPLEGDRGAFRESHAGRGAARPRRAGPAGVREGAKAGRGVAARGNSGAGGLRGLSNPAPGSDLYAPFLVIAARFWAGAEKLGDDELGGMPVYFTPFDDGAVLAVNARVKNGESPPQAFARLETFVRETIEPALDGQELAGARQQLGFLLGTTEIPDELLAQNPYGVCFSLARREQLGLDARKLDGELAKVTDKDIRRVAKEFFDPGRRAETLVAEQK